MSVSYVKKNPQIVGLLDFTWSSPVEFIRLRDGSRYKLIFQTERFTKSVIDEKVIDKIHVYYFSYVDLNFQGFL